MKIIKQGYRNVLVIALLLSFCMSCTTKVKQEVRAIDDILVQNAADVVFGNDSVSNTIFLYASYNCIYCRYLFSKTFPELKENYLDKDLVKVVVKFLDFGDDPQTQYALKAASCIYRFGSYQKFHELLLTDPAIVTTENFNMLLDDIMAQNADIAECIWSENDDDFLNLNLAEFRKNDLSGTPTMVINQHVYSGFVSYEKLDVILKNEFHF